MPTRHRLPLFRLPLLWLPGLIAAAPVAAQPQASAQTQPLPKPEPSQAPITQRDSSAVDVVATPVTDLGLRKGEIPPILLAAENDPYGIPQGGRCPGIAADVRRLDAVLGDDFDVAQAPSGKVRPGKVAQSVVGSFIPFRGVIRELSGANEQERRLQAAIYAGAARRAFLKGVGLQRGCAWPARPATPQMLAQIAAQNEAKARAAGAAGQRR